jgi:glycosyltransferase involved in cell wall biosynthesis
MVSINIPCYRQLDLARRCLETIRAQSLGDFEVTFLDDGGSEEYRLYVESLGDPRIRYRRNPERLGAMRNMFQAVAEGSGDYSLAFHEDDLLGRNYLSAAVRLMDAQPRCGFVAVEMHEFDDEPPPAGLATAFLPASAQTFEDGADFLRGIFRGVNPMFGSVLYRRSAIDGIEADLARYATLADRPFLLRILERWSAVVIRQPLAWYRRHGEGDARHRGLTAAQILNLLRAYRATLPAPLSDDDRRLFNFYTGYWLLEFYKLLTDDQRPALGPFLLRAWRDGVYDPRAQRGAGRRQILRAILGGGQLPR